ncbi:FOG: Transposon-encoded proteins with TYA, reverse transcriptase, integrase domains in various combinations [Ceraceosorus bombacis]|uniref:FOG: Transposon-encoded proteins with TYA, reverse transcriptase, integrase domains in various combinations n=1 Tax=Ceraceosorus bombacis TaxID=401625 RepID=A0A0N7L9S9_9BASI|nr:FOG: Transposon-encoded proteins with TYA, reverse transcriptase, integrase domains in various combinations [Ceraceosorus bombacis]
MAIPAPEERISMMGDASFCTPKSFWKQKKTKESCFLLMIREAANDVTDVDPNTPPGSHDDALDKILLEYKAVFCKELPLVERPDEIPPTCTLKDSIIPTEGDPVNIRSYQLTAAQLREQDQQIEGLVERGLIRESSSSWGFPVLFVPKKGGEYWMCIDYRALNQRTRKNRYPLPRIQDCLDQLGLAKVFSKLDLTSGYWQIRLPPSDVEKTAFNMQNGKWEWLVMPFGLANAPSTFQAIVNRTLGKYIGKFVIVYLDDILIFSDSVEEHREHVRLVLAALKEAKLYAKPSKCAFNMKEIDFCGHLVGDGKVCPLKDKLWVVKEWPTPKTAHDVRSFVGLTTYYRRFVQGFAKICAPLHDLLKGSSPSAKAEQKREVVWLPEHQDAFDHLKVRLCAAPALAQPDTSKPFFVETDASQYAIGAVLLQETTDGKMHPVAYDGRKMKPAKLNYSVSEQELLAIKYALNTWKHYVDNGFTTTILTDHQNLETIPRTKVASKRLARWLEEFQEVDLDIKYQRGELNIPADAISRRADWVNSLNEEPSTLEDLRRWFLGNATDPPESIAADLKNWRYDPRTERLLHRVAGARAEEDWFAPYVEPQHRAAKMYEVHREGGHSGYQRLKHLFVSKYWWPKQLPDLEYFIKACPACQVHKPTVPMAVNKRKYVIADETIKPFQRWGIDHVGPFDESPSGNSYMICAIDYATLWPLARAVPDTKTEHVLRFLLEEIYPVFGPPKEVFSDNAKSFLAEAVSELFLQSETRHRIATAYHPQTNGKVKAWNKQMKRMIKTMMFDRGIPRNRWDELVPLMLTAAQWRTHSTMGISPYKAVFGLRPPVNVEEFVALPWEAVVESDEPRCSQQTHWRTAAGASMRKVVEQEVRRFNAKYGRQANSFNVGDYVMKRNKAQQGLKGGWFGPYVICEKWDRGAYVLESMDQLREPVFGNRLRKITEPFGKQLWFNEAARTHFRRAVSGHRGYAALREGGNEELVDDTPESSTGCIPWSTSAPPTQ